jgi:hypothetical protein
MDASLVLPELPVEIHGDILRFCDPSTLASTSRVSLAFLELSGSFLYQDIVARGTEQLYLLVRSKVRHRSYPERERAESS